MAASSQDSADATAGFYTQVLGVLNRSDIPYLVGGAYALQRYTGIERYTRDLDIFVEPKVSERVLRELSHADFQTELTFRHWLGKVHQDDQYVDVIFSSGNGVATVDREWFDYATEGEVLGIPVRLCPVEEMIWSKAFIMERERFDGADIIHLLHARAEQLDWARLLRRFGSHSRLLLAHVILFGFVYPAERGRIPDRVLRELLDRLEDEAPNVPPGQRLCQGTLLSRAQYLTDIDRGYWDARMPPTGMMSAEDIAVWTAAALMP